MSPVIAAGGGWLGIYFATLAWSLGCTGVAALLVSGKVVGPPMIFLAALCFGASIAISQAIGAGELLYVPTTNGGGVPGALQFILDVAYAAMLTYGPLGALIGAGVGVWLGVRIGHMLAE